MLFWNGLFLGAEMLRLFLSSRSGAIAIAFALLVPVLLSAVGFAVDFAVMVSARSKLQSAADSGILAASMEGLAEAQRNATFRNHLAANFPEHGMSIAETDVKIVDGINHLTVNAHVSADVDLFFFRQFSPRRISVAASTFRSVTDMEISIVLDNTGSMGSGGIAALKRASHALVDQVDAARGPSQQVRVGLVPFVTAVNIRGEGFDPAWIDRDGQALYNGWNFLDQPLRQERRTGVRRTSLPAGFGSVSSDAASPNADICLEAGAGRCERADDYPHHMRLFERSGTSWKGCVEARPYPYNFDMEAPSQARPDTLFVPYFAPDEPGIRRTDNGGNDGNHFNNSWLDDEVEGTEAERQRSTLKYMYPAGRRVFENGPLSVGPNRACPTPIVPLTTELSKVRTGIDAMNFWNGSGTNIAEGLAWGWRLLSPGEPFAQAGAFNPQEREKFLVLMTDGRNVSFGARNTINRSDYGAYSFLDNGRINGTVNPGTAESTLNSWTLDMCGRMKAQGIQIYTVLYNETATSVQNMFRSCASRPDNFYMTSSTAGLEAAFASIGRQMSALRLTH